MSVGAWVGAASLAIASAMPGSGPVIRNGPADDALQDARPVLAIVSPFGYAACSAAGVSSLLVPLLGGVVEDQLGIGDTVNVGEVVLDAIGPVFVVCGSLPEAPGRRCQLDGEIAAVWPAQLNTATLSPPVAGAAVDSVEAGLALLGLPPEAALDEALECEFPSSAAAPKPGAAPPRRPDSAGAPPSSNGPGLETALGAAPPLIGVPDLAPEIDTVTGNGRTRRVLGAVAGGSAGPGLALQLVVAAMLAGFLIVSWLRSFRIAAADR